MIKFEVLVPFECKADELWLFMGIFGFIFCVSSLFLGSKGTYPPVEVAVAFGRPEDV